LRLLKEAESLLDPTYGLVGRSHGEEGVEAFIPCEIWQCGLPVLQGLAVSALWGALLHKASLTAVTREQE
jgi:hypothetical protein